MNILDVIHRDKSPRPWDEGEKIPWNDAHFSRRMLAEHLSQKHDAASRRFEIVDAQFEWIHTRLLGERPTRILDLGCGPGLYTQRLAKLGHQCVGIDFSPASIAYANEQAKAMSLDCTYLEADVRSADFGGGFGLVMMIFGEFNVFRPDDARTILKKAHLALMPGGALLLEPHVFEKVVAIGQQPALWQSAQKGLFSDRPYVLLQESFWDTDQRVAIRRYYVVDATT